MTVTIGHVEDLQEGQLLAFLVVRNGSDLVFHAGVADGHSFLARDLGFSDRSMILGGGGVAHCGSVIRLAGRSGSFGGVPAAVLRPITAELDKRWQRPIEINTEEFCLPADHEHFLPYI